MDIYGTIFLTCVSILFGMILMVFLQYCVLLKYFKQSPKVDVPRKPFSEAFSLPEALKKHLENENYNNEESKNCSVPISLMMQFLFHELRHSDSIKRWLYKKLSLEFDELLTKTTTGKFFEAVTIRDMHLGSQFPDIKNISVENVILDKSEGHIDILNLCVQLDYTGHFLLSVDAKMKFGKTAYLSIKVKRVCGLARLQFTRLPYTHWSFSFYSDPLIELGVESQFQGRQLQSNITSLIINQIKKAIKRKHTLPNYKIRYKPFFNKTDPGQLDIDDCEIVPQGILEITCVEVSRLSAIPDVTNVYCTVTIDTIPWIRLKQNQNAAYVVMDLTIMKNRQQQLGIVFKQEQLESKSIVTVETIVPHSPAHEAGLCPGDCLLAVDSKSVTNMTQVAKIVKSITATSFCVRIQRIVKNYIFTSKQGLVNFKTEMQISKSDSADELDDILDAERLVTDKKSDKILTENIDISKKPKSIASIESRFKNSDKLPKLLSSSNENVSKLAQTIGSFSLRKRKQSAERSSNDGSSKSTPNASTTNTPQHARNTTNTTGIFSKKIVDKTISEDATSVGKTETSPDIEIKNICLQDVTECYEGPLLELESVINFNDEHSFTLRENDKYLNINIWGRNKQNEDILLGYTNIPLLHVLNECCNSMLGHYISSYSFLPPDNTPPTSQSHPLLSHSGFEHCFCYGDILLSFMWISDDVTNVKRKSSMAVETPNREECLKSQYAKHDFIRTQFHRTTHCDFCSKKIWLKDAVQCRNCALCCHKKCVLKCQTSTTCTCLDSIIKTDGQDFPQPEITMTEVCDDQINELTNSEESVNKQYSETSSFNGSNNSLKRVNSVNSLAIPGAHSLPNSQSRSLPPSPQHTPSRKQSIVNLNPFALCPALLEICFHNPNDSSTLESISQIIDQLLQCNQDENLMDIAKETGIQFYSTIPHEQRTDKINILMSELKKTLDITTSDHMDLSKQLNSEVNPTEKARLAFLMGQADAKVHALSVLMLHYCSGMQQVQEKIV